VVGRKIGATSKEVQRWAGVDQPDYGVLFDAFTFEDGTSISRSAERMISPRIEAELGFVLKKDVKGPGVTSMHLLACIEAIIPVFEIVDSRIRDWKIKIADTIADNSSSWGIVLGNQAVSPFGIDLSTPRAEFNVVWRKENTSPLLQAFLAVVREVAQGEVGDVVLSPKTKNGISTSQMKGLR
jgi:2-keto-4-pentenoate hydratase